MVYLLFGFCIVAVCSLLKANKQRTNSGQGANKERTKSAQTRFVKAKGKEQGAEGSLLFAIFPANFLSSHLYYC